MILAWLLQYGTLIGALVALATYGLKLLERHEEKAARQNAQFVLDTWETWALDDKGRFWLKAYLKELLDL